MLIKRGHLLPILCYRLATLEATCGYLYIMMCTKEELTNSCCLKQSFNEIHITNVLVFPQQVLHVVDLLISVAICEYI